MASPLFSRENVPCGVVVARLMSNQKASGPILDAPKIAIFLQIVQIWPNSLTKLSFMNKIILSAIYVVLSTVVPPDEETDVSADWGSEIPQIPL